MGSYDVALVYRDDDGKVQHVQAEKPTSTVRGRAPPSAPSWASSFPPAILGTALVGAAAGAGIGHALGGMSRSDAKELGEGASAMARPRWS